jgi:hypothetical protein
MTKPSAKVICHSKAPNGEELITLEIELHRFVLPEFNTHRCLSRNFQSSRAVPVTKMIEQVRSKPAIPVHWGKNQKGMVAEIENQSLVSNGEYTSEEWWSLAAISAARFAEELHDAGYHKQIVNRLLEPFMWTKGVVTATRTGFESFFKLRSHKDAQPEIKALSDAMRASIEGSTPNELNYGQYHLPYVDVSFEIEDAVKVSTSCCAQVSYRTLDDSLDKALKIYDMLNLPVDGVYKRDEKGDIEPPHCFDEGTEVLTSTGFEKWSDIKKQPLAIVCRSSGRFSGFCDNYKLIERDIEEELFHFNGNKIDLMVTKGHQIYGSLIDNERGRANSDFRLFPADMDTPPRSKKKYSAMRPMKMLRSCLPRVTERDISNSEYNLYKLYGFFIGDGSLPSDGSKNILKFRLKKKRKIEYLVDICKGIDDCSLKIYKGGNINVTLKGAFNTFSMFYTWDRKKTIPTPWAMSQDQELIDALFDGLKNSDGSLKGRTWTYSTSSEKLKEDILAISPVFGYNPTISYVNTFEKDNHNTNWIINFSNRREVLVNDSRTEQSTALTEYKGKVYCADTGGNVLIVRRNGKVILSGNCSPTEHIAKVTSEYDMASNYGIIESSVLECSGNFHSGSFWQYRKALEDGYENLFIGEE